MKLYRYSKYFGRMGDLGGMFAVDAAGDACLSALVASGREVYFGEVLGKHSDVVTVVEAKDLVEVVASEEEIETVLRVLGVARPNPVSVVSGFCPLECEGTCEVQGADELLRWAQGRGTP